MKSKSNDKDLSRAGNNSFGNLEGFPLELLFDAVQDPVMLCEYTASLSNAQIIAANEEALSRLGYLHRELVDRPISDVVCVASAGADDLRRLREGRKIFVQSTCQPSEGDPIPVRLSLTLQAVNGSSVLCAVCRDLSNRDQLTEALERRTAQQKTLGEIAQLSLDEHNIPDLLKGITRRIGHTLDVTYGAVLKKTSDGGSLRLTAGCGWPKRDYDQATVSAEPAHPVGRSFLESQTIRIDSFESEEDFTRCALLRSQPIESCLSTSIKQGADEYGVLLAASSLPGQFHASDESFVEEVAQIIGTILDQRTAKEALRKSETKYRRLFKDSRDALFIVAPDGEILAANPAAETMFGYEAWEVKAQDLYVDPSVRLEFRKQLEEQGFVQDFEVKMKRRDGTEIDCLMTSTARWSADGHAEAYQTIIRDITAHKAAQKALEASEEKFRTFTEQALVGVYIVQNGQFEYVNPRFAEMFDYTPEEIVREISPLDLVHPEDHTLVAHRIRERLQGSSDSANYTFRALTRHDEPINVEVYGTVIEHKGEPAILGTIIDITERRRLERQILRVSEEERRRIGQDLHDGLGQMLTGIGMMAKNLSETLADNDSKHATVAREISNLINEADRHAHELAHGLTPVDLDTGGLLAALQQLSTRTRQLFDVDCEVNCRVSISLDDTTTATNLYRIAQEAVTNAVKHGKAESIEIAVRRVEKQLRLSVCDDGCGISLDAKHSSDQAMGIDLMRYRARIIGGSIDIERSPDGGTSVTCSIYAP